jgi:hypothetical protein
MALALAQASSSLAIARQPQNPNQAVAGRQASGLAVQPRPTPAILEGNVGIAAKYPGDVGIENDPDVIFAESFEGSVDEICSHWESVSGKQIMSKSDDIVPGSGGNQSLLLTRVAGGTEGYMDGGSLYRRLNNATGGYGYDQVFFRFYMKFNDGHAPIHHYGSGLVGFRPTTPWPQGGAGERPIADARWSTQVEPSTFESWNLYSYWHGMGGSPPRGQTWGNNFESGVPARPVAKEKWICLEVMVKMNDVGDTNGEQAYWLDGKLSRNEAGKITSYIGKGFPSVGTWVYDKFKPYVTEQGVAWDYDQGKGVSLAGGKPFPGFAWRSTPDLNINAIWLYRYMSRPETGVSKVWWDHLVVARTYIGPLAPLTGSQAAQHNNRIESNGWNREGVAQYLDRRLDAWFANAKKLQTGEGETACISCHTTVPYMLSRAALRRAMHVSQPTPHELRLVEEATRRVETYDAQEPLYDFNEEKKVESRGTEAVLNALVLAVADAEQGRRESSEPVRKAFRQLWQTQRPDGAWDWLDFGLEPFETIDAAYHGATLAALAVGTATLPSQTTDGAPGIEKLRAYLIENYSSQSLFNRTWALLASTQWKDLLRPSQRDTLITEIQSRQREDGGWSLQSLATWKWSKRATPYRPPGTLDATLLERSDGYATGLIVYALRQAGVPIEHPTVSNGLRWLRTNQQDVQVNDRTHSVWRAYSLNFDREQGGAKGEPWRRLFMSDAATAFAVLALVTPE